MAIEVSTQRGRFAKAPAASAVQRYRCANLIWALACAFVMNPAALAQTGPQLCGNPFQNHFGPFDYRASSVALRKIVEEVHFTVGIESITRPKNTQFHEMAQDVEYTLNVFPNHHRALITMQRLADRWRRDPPPGTSVTVECWFDRAVRFRPDDTVARALYAQYLSKQKRRPDAVRQLDLAIEHAKDNPLSHYNIGLVFFEMEEFDRALVQAHKAQAMGYPRPELADSLKRVNKWTEPSPAQASEPQPAQSATNEGAVQSTPQR